MHTLFSKFRKLFEQAWLPIFVQDYPGAGTLSVEHGYFLHNTSLLFTKQLLTFPDTTKITTKSFPQNHTFFRRLMP